MITNKPSVAHVSDILYRKGEHLPLRIWMENTLNPPDGSRLPLATAWPTLGLLISLRCAIIGHCTSHTLQEGYIKYSF